MRAREGTGTVAGVVQVVEVAARDGLQSEPVSFDTADKLRLLEAVARAGLERMEVASFVDPARVPQMADAEAVVEGFLPRAGLTRIGLVLNVRGMRRAVAAGVEEVNYVVGVTDAFSIANQGVPTARTLEGLAEVMALARGASVSVSVTLSVAFGCPYEGEVSDGRLATVLEAAARAQPDELALADTIGVAVPRDAVRRVELARRVVSDAIPLRCHFHDTRHSGVASALAAADAGVGALDASLGGIGGCPFAPEATGNVATEDLVFALERSGLSTGVDLDVLCEGARWLSQRLGRPVPGTVSRTSRFPPGRAPTG